MNVTYRIRPFYRICYHISNTTGATCGAGSANPSGAREITPSFWWGSCCLFFSFLCYVMCTIVCLFVFFIFSHGIASLFSIYEFDCPFGIFRPSFFSSFKQSLIGFHCTFLSFFGGGLSTNVYTIASRSQKRFIFCSRILTMKLMLLFLSIFFLWFPTKFEYRTDCQLHIHRYILVDDPHYIQMWVTETRLKDTGHM